MGQRFIEEINFIETLAGLILAPHETTGLLFQTKNPPFAWTLFLCLLLSIYVPIFAQTYKYGYSIAQPGVVLSLTLLIFFGLLMFLVIDGVFLQPLKVEFNMQMLFSCIAYSLTPLILCLWLIYGFNYLSDGKLTLITYILTGFGSLVDNFLKIIPYATSICLLWVVVVFLYGIKSMAQLNGFLSVCVTLLAVVPFILSSALGLFVGEMAYPGTARIVLTLLRLYDY